MTNNARQTPPAEHPFKSRESRRPIAAKTCVRSQNLPSPIRIAVACVVADRRERGRYPPALPGFCTNHTITHRRDPVTNIIPAAQPNPAGGRSRRHGPLPLSRSG